MALSTVRVLLVSNNEDDFLFLRTLVAQSRDLSLELDWEADYDVALVALRHHHYDAYLIDYHLGERRGLTLLRAAIASGCTAPIIVLTTEVEEAGDIAALHLGAADYIVRRDVSAELLGRVLRYAIERKQTLRVLRERENALQALEIQVRRAQHLEAIDHLTSSVAHHLNNLLTVISGNAQLLQQMIRSGDAGADELEDIRGASAGATELTKQLLELANKKREAFDS